MYWLANKSLWYDDEVTRSMAKWAKCLCVLTNSQAVDSLSPFSIIIFVSTYKLAYDTSSVRVGASSRLSQFSMKCSRLVQTRDAVRFRMARRQKEATGNSHCKDASCIFETYATVDVLAEADIKMMHFVQLSRKSPMEFSGAFLKKALRCERECEEYVCKDILRHLFWGITRVPLQQFVLLLEIEEERYLAWFGLKCDVIDKLVNLFTQNHCAPYYLEYRYLTMKF